VIHDTKSPRNRTIDFTPDEKNKYLNRCLTAAECGQYTVAAITDRTIRGDTFSLLPELPRAFARLVIADPPYNLSKQYGATKFSATDHDAYSAYTKQWLDLVLPVLTQDGSLYICVDWRSSICVGSVLAAYEAEKKLIIRNRITWEREKGRGAAANWKNSMEDIWFVTAGTSYQFHLDAVRMRRRVIAPYTVAGEPKDWVETPQGKFRDTCPSNFWNDISVPFWSMPENTAHPAQKSEKLLAKLILASSAPADIVFDPFLGSGSTSVTAKKLGRHWCGIEREAQYCAWTEYRLEQADTDRSIQGFTDGIFRERNS
jgi:site-specific DNA-methyltransferase (adenine-specific)